MYSINYYNLLSLKSRASLVTATVRVFHVCDTLRLAQFTYLVNLATPSNCHHFVKCNKKLLLAFQLILS